MTTLPRQPVARLLGQRAHDTPEHVLAADEDGRTLTCASARQRALATARWLAGRGVPPGGRVLSALGNGIDHLVLFYACCHAGMVWVPVNPQTRGPALAHILRTTRPDLVLHEDDAAAAFTHAMNTETPTPCVSRGDPGWIAVTGRDPGDDDEQAPITPGDDLDSLRCVIFTSGTTGPPKGVMVSERMLLTAATATRLAARCEPGDRFLMWEPLHHIGGSQLGVLALLESIQLRIVARFSASRFWGQVREWEITQIHYLGGIIDILLQAPERDDDAGHPARLAFGAGARPDAWRAFERRFGIPVHEVYGMTEASSFSTLNDEGVIGSVGRALPWFELDVVDANGRPVADGEPGELTVTAREPGLLTAGYLGDPDASAELLRGGRLFTGDLMRRDASGHYRYVGRRRDAIRRRGENLSAWEIEQALLLHPDIAEAAVIGVEASIGEQELHAFVRRRDDALTHHALHAWCREHLGRHQVPRYFSFVDAFPRTPSQRIAKSALCPDPSRTWDSEASGLPDSGT